MFSGSKIKKTEDEKMLKEGSKNNPSIDNGVKSARENLLCCLFCYKICDDGKGNNNITGGTRTSGNNVKTMDLENPSQLLLQKFLLLFRRCLIDINCIKRSDFLHATTFFRGRVEDGFQFLGICQDCSFLLRDFCSLYDSIKCLELKLDWRLKNLLEIMKSAEKVPSRVNEFRNHISFNDRGKNDIHSVEPLIGIKKIRNELKAKCSAKLQSSHPRIVLKRIGSSEATNCGFDATKGIQVEATTVDSASPCATTPVTISEIKSEIVNMNETVPFPLTVTPEREKGVDVEVSSTFFVKVVPSEGYDEYFERNATADIDGEGQETSSQPPDKLDPEDFDDADLHSPPPTSPILSLGGTGIDDDDGEPGTSPSTNASDNEDLVKKRKYLNQNWNVSSNIKVEIPNRLNVESVTVRASNNKGKINFAQVKLEKVAASSLTNANEVPVKVETILSIRKKSARKHFNAKKVEYQRRESKRLLKKAKTITKTKSVCRKGEKGRKIRRYDVYPSISNGKRLLLSLKQLALNKVMRLSKTLRCRIQPCKNKSFINPRDFMNHSKYHGEFKCNFCKKVFDYAPHLLTHEIDDHHEQTEDVEKSHACPRCPHSSTKGRNSKSVLIHFLESHLNITPAKNTCSICDATIYRYGSGSTRNDFLQHYRSHHELAGVDVSTIKKCDISNCRAYFRTHFQLNQHKLKIHNITTKMKYVCRDCGMRHLNVLDLQHHQLNHTVQTVFKVACPLPECKRLFETEADLLCHEKLYHKIEMIDCPRCNESIQKWKLDNHLKKHKTLDTHKLKIHRCLESGCKKEFYNISDLENHSRLHGEFNCQFCETVVTFAANLPIHEIKYQKRCNVDEDNVSERFACTRCMSSVNTESKFIAHFVEEHLQLEMDRHTCFICKAQIGSYETYKKIKSHFKQLHDLRNVGPDGKTYACKIDGCPAFFLKPHQLAKHKSYHLIDGKFKIRQDYGDGKTFECGDCKKRFSKSFMLRTHRISFHLQMKFKSFKCPTKKCKLRFETQAELDDHVADYDVLKCPKCEKSFHGAVGLKLHEKFHKKQDDGQQREQWICETCGKGFKGEERLRLHRFSHTGPDTWEFLCNICSKKCLTKGKLNDHMRTHTNEKPYICKICGVKYAHRHNLRIHVNNKHGDIVTDKPRTLDKTNLSSRKGVKVKKQNQEEAGDPGENERDNLL